MKVIIKITGARPSYQRADYFYIAKDRQNNVFMFYSNRQLKENNYFLMDVINFKPSISDVVMLDVTTYKLYTLTIKGNVLTFNGKPIRSEEIIFKGVNLQRVADINKKMKQIREKKPKESMLVKRKVG